MDTLARYLTCFALATSVVVYAFFPRPGREGIFIDPGLVAVPLVALSLALLIFTRPKQS